MARAARTGAVLDLRKRVDMMDVENPFYIDTGYHSSHTQAQHGSNLTSLDAKLVIDGISFIGIKAKDKSWGRQQLGLGKGPGLD